MSKDRIRQSASFVANANRPAENPAHETYELGSAALGLKSSILSTIIARRKHAREGRSPLYIRLAELGISHEEFVSAVEQARLSGASPIQELVARGVLDTEGYFRKLAQDMGLTFASFINPDTILSDMNLDMMEHGNIPQVFGRGSGGLSLLYVSPDFAAEASIAELLERDPEQKKRIRICTPASILIALEAKQAKNSLNWATNDLHQRHPNLSAKQVFAPWQAYILGLVCVALPVCLYQQFLLSSLIIHVASSLLFSVVVFIRIAALRSLKRRKEAPLVSTASSFPKYSVLVALHKEAAIANQLVRAMSRLDWPHSRLEVLYVCEVDDCDTIEALLAIGLPDHHRIIRVPAGVPRTKPKALNYALKACRGDFVVIYDAEDRPHPQQLQEAWSKFAVAEESLACLQAPLVVTNARASWFSRMFAFEYASHFTGLLPFLAQSGVPLPLGGTSNHFRKSSLEAIGGWDPYNVTEDADLGIRFYRFGFKCDVINLPTLEDGPETFKEWYPQRTRWQKGWMQTFLVHNRNIVRLFEVLGNRNAIHFEALLIGFILSPILYSASLLMAAYSVYSLDLTHIAFTVIDLFLLFMGYFCSITLGLECVRKWSRLDKFIVAITLPIYWFLLSAASWRAVYQLIVKPHHWEKTPHKPVKEDAMLADHCLPSIMELPALQNHQ